MFPSDLESQIEQAVLLLKQGEAVAVPTETVYGLAARIDQTSSIEKIFRLKERPFFDPLIVHVSDYQSLEKVAESPSAAELSLMKAVWPGPCTFILKKKSSLDPLITSGLDTVGVRMPSHPVARAVLERLGVPFAAPSANKFGKTSPTKAQHVRGDWPNQEVFIVDGGDSEFGLESTVLQVFEESPTEVRVEILRPGVVTETMIRKVFADLSLAVQVIRKESSASPGHTPQHYMPTLPLVIVDPESGAFDSTMLQKISSQLGLSANGEPQFVLLQLNSDPRIAARELYEKLHTLSESKAHFILCPFAAEHRSEAEANLWVAIWDRLSRAASLIF